jgi:hypothetical protein
MGVIAAREGEKASGAALRWLDEHPQDNLARPGLGRVVFDKRSVSDTLGHGFSGPKLSALTAVPDVVREGTELYAGMDWDGRPILNRVLAAPIELGGSRYTMFVRLRRNTVDPMADTRFYVHEAVLEDYITNSKASPFKTGSDPEVFRGKKSGGTSFYISLARRALGVNEMTKALELPRLILIKSLVRGHTRRLASGKTITVGPYSNTVFAKLKLKTSRNQAGQGDLFGLGEGVGGRGDDDKPEAKTSAAAPVADKAKPVAPANPPKLTPVPPNPEGPTPEEAADPRRKYVTMVRDSGPRQKVLAPSSDRINGSQRIM